MTIRKLGVVTVRNVETRYRVWDVAGISPHAQHSHPLNVLSHQVFVEQCRELDIAIVATSPGAASLARQSMLRRQAAASPVAGNSTVTPSSSPVPPVSVQVGGAVDLFLS